jgi:nucleotide-binding universal stress UspA family protein
MDTGPRFVVLAAVDDGPLDSEVVRVGANFARGSAGGELHLVHVIEDLPPPLAVVPRPMGLGISAPEIVAAARKRVDTLSAEARARFAGRIVEHLAAGAASRHILQVAIDIQADVVLVGTHGRTGLKRVLLGSVAETVARRASCPVIVVRPKGYEASPSPDLEAVCPDCLRMRREIGEAHPWCERHSAARPQSHLSYEFAEGGPLAHDQSS